MTLLQSHTKPDAWRDLLGQIAAANDAGLRMTRQVRTRRDASGSVGDQAPQPRQRGGDRSE